MTMKINVRRTIVQVVLCVLSGCETTTGNDDNTDTGGGSCDGTAYLDENLERYVVCHPTTTDIWLRCPIGQNWNPKTSACEGEITQLTYLDAQDACPEGYGLPTNDDFSTILCNFSQTMISDCPADHYASCSECSICDLMFPTDTGQYLSADSIPIYDGEAYRIFVFDFNTGCVIEDADLGRISYQINVHCIKKDS